MKNKIKNLSVYILYIMIIIVSISLFFNLKYITNKIVTELNLISPYVKNEDWDTFKIKFTKFNDEYTKKIDRLSLIINHEEIDMALSMIEDVFTNIELKNKDLCLNILESLKFKVSNFYQSQIPNIINIF